MTKLTIIGAGSTVFTKNIVVYLMTIDNFKSIEIALMDINKNRLDKTLEVLKIISKTLIFNVLLRLLKKRSKSCFSCDKSIQCPSLCLHYPQSNLCTPNSSWKKFYTQRSKMRESGNVNINAFDLKNAYSLFIHIGKNTF